MTGPVLTYLGETRLELGPARDAAADGHWRYAVGEDGIGWLALDKRDAGTNTISEEVLTELAALLDRIEAETPRALVIRSAKLGGFAAGADIGGFGEMAAGDAEAMLRRGHDVLDRIEALPCPTIAIVHGQALGAGFELALACDHRVAIDGAAFGFPEVRLGLHPGLGGTFRLPALIDPTEAMTLMLTGKTAHVGKAKKLGIAGIVTEERHVAAAVRAVAAGEVEAPSQGLKAGAFRLGPARRLAARRMRSETEKKAPAEHYPAPHALIDLWEQHGDDPKAMQAAEIESFARLLGSDTAKNLIRVFFLRQKLKANAKGEDGIAHVHVVGAGAMGAEIAAWSAIRGKTVTLGDVETEALGRAVSQAAKVCQDSHLSSIETRDALDRMIPDVNGHGIARADLVIEAVPEKPELKQKIYSSLSNMKEGAILATNTSSLRLTELREGAPDPSRFAGLHFFNPVSKMQLVEVVRHDGTSDETASGLAAFCGAIDRLPAPVTDYPGFLVNRALMPYLMEALVLVEEGVDKETVDRAALDFGMPMGPVTLADQVGLDICLDVAESLKGNLEKPMPDIPDRLRRMVEDGHTGKKAGRGFYDWSDGSPKPEAKGTSPDDLTDRLILPMLDACAECLRREVARDDDEVDAAMIFATGFAPFRGGPMHYAHARGPAAIRARLEELAERHGPRFAPDPFWSNLA